MSEQTQMQDERSASGQSRSTVGLGGITLSPPSDTDAGRNKPRLAHICRGIHAKCTVLAKDHRATEPKTAFVVARHRTVPNQYSTGYEPQIELGTCPTHQCARAARSWRTCEGEPNFQWQDEQCFR